MAAIGKKHFAPLEDYEEARAFWWTRFLRIAGWFEGWERERRAGATRIFAEMSGKHSIPLGKTGFLLTARADRIERRADGSYAILDYKTGQPPTPPQIKRFLAPQLLLEGAMLQNGGFNELGKRQAEELLYLRFSGGREPGEIQPVDNSLIDEALARLRQRVIDFSAERTCPPP